VSPTNDLVDALAPVVAALEHVQLAHCIGGSVASSFHGAARSTMDVNLLCEMPEDRITEFLGCLDQDFYVSEIAVREAVERKSCFNLIHLPTSFKIDVFVSEGRPFDITRMRRATREHLGSGRTIIVPMTSPEDSIISKLEWYRKGNQTSERQWDDVSKLVHLLNSSADLDYLQEAAESVGVSDLLSNLLSNN
jgi:hypothetical protein